MRVSLPWPESVFSSQPSEPASAANQRASASVSEPHCLTYKTSCEDKHHHQHPGMSDNRCPVPMSAHCPMMMMM